MSDYKKTVAILGSTGSIGVQSLESSVHLGYKIKAISLNSNIKAGEEQIRKYHPEYCAVSDENAAKALKLAVSDTDTVILGGELSPCEALEKTRADVCINGISGFAGLKPTLAAIEFCGRPALANKESLVCAGELVKEKAQRYGKEIIPVDSEHSAIYRCLKSGDSRSVRRLIITCSGGAFYGKTREELSEVTKDYAFLHPTWKMGHIITVNCATLMNKGFEVIEAARLFGINGDRISVVIHRESIIHSIVEYNDFAMIAQLSVPDMRIPIQYALEYPLCTESLCKPLDLTETGKLTFSKPDNETFPLLSLAYRALERGGCIPCAMNAANEIAVDLFIRNKISFNAISDIVGEVTEGYKDYPVTSLDDVERTDAEARRSAIDTAKHYLLRR